MTTVEKKNFADNLNDVIDSQPMKAIRTYEKVKTTVTFVIMTIICFIFIIVGIFLIKASAKKVGIIANVTKNSECYIGESYDNKNRKISSMICNTTVEFTVNDTKYTGIVNSEGIKYNQNSPIKIYYDQENPNNISYSNSQKYLGIGLITFFFMVFILLSINLFATFKSKTYSSIKGLSDIGGIIGSTTL